MCGLGRRGSRQGRWHPVVAAVERQDDATVLFDVGRIDHVVPSARRQPRLVQVVEPLPEAGTPVGGLAELGRQQRPPRDGPDRRSRHPWQLGRWSPGAVPVTLRSVGNRGHLPPHRRRPGGVEFPDMQVCSFAREEAPGDSDSEAGATCRNTAAPPSGRRCVLTALLREFRADLG